MLHALCNLQIFSIKSVIKSNVSRSTIKYKETVYSQKLSAKLWKNNRKQTNRVAGKNV